MPGAVLVTRGAYSVSQRASKIIASDVAQQQPHMCTHLTLSASTAQGPTAWGNRMRKSSTSMQEMMLASEEAAKQASFGSDQALGNHG